MNSSRSQGGFNSRIVSQNSISHVSKAFFETSDGNYFAAGISYDTLNGQSFGRIVTMGLNSNGQLQWIKKIGSKQFQYIDNSFSSRTFFKLNNYIYQTGIVKDSNNKYKGVLIKFDLNGDTIWQKIFLDPNKDLIPQMCANSVDGGFLITGFFQDFINQTQPGLLIKTDANGNELWRKEIHKAVPDVMDGKGIIQDSATKKIIIVGYQYKYTATDFNSFDNLLILDSLGNVIQQLSNTIGVTEDIIQTKDKNLVVVGGTIGSDTSRSFIYKFNINSPSQKIWQNFEFGSPTYVNYFSCLRELKNGDLLIAGSYDTSMLITGIQQGLNRITRLNSSGTLISNRFYKYSNHDSTNCTSQILSLEIDSKGGWLTSTKINCSSFLNPFHFTKYDSTGCDSSAAYCATANLVGIQKVNRDNSDLCIFPNPAQDQVQIQFSNAEIQKFNHFQIFNSIGQVIREEEIDLTNNKVLLSTKELPNGIYILTFNANTEGRIVKKLVISR